jgi:hypothetical protein
MASMAELARQLLGMNGNSVGGVSPDRYMEIIRPQPTCTELVSRFKDRLR